MTSVVSKSWMPVSISEKEMNVQLSPKYVLFRAFFRWQSKELARQC